MSRKPKVLIKPKSLLGIKHETKICWNCQFRYRDDTGYCPMISEYVDYNKSSISCKLFRYRIEYNLRNTNSAGIPYDDL